MNENSQKDVITTIQNTFRDLEYFDENFNVNVINPLLVMELITLALQVMDVYKRNEKLISRFVGNEIQVVRNRYPNNSLEPAMDILNGGVYKALDIRHSEMDNISREFSRLEFNEVKDFLIERFS